MGRNGSGKSNLADVLSFISEAMASPLQAVFDRRGGVGAVRNRSSGQQSYPPNLGLAFEFGQVNGIDGGRFAFEVKALPNYGYRIVREQCLVRKHNGARWWFDREDTWKSNVKGLTPAPEPSALAMPLVGGDERFAPIFRVLGAMRVYSIQPAKLREMQDPDSGVAKDVTFETLNRPDFLESVQQAFPRINWEKAYSEFKAAGEASPPQPNAGK